jgi:hypothetical protein
MATNSRCLSRMYNGFQMQDTYLSVNAIIRNANWTTQDEGRHPVNIIGHPETPFGNLSDEWIDILPVL